MAIRLAVLKVREGREGSERRLYPQMREQWPSYEGKRKMVSPRLFGDQKKIQAMARVKARFDGADQVNYALNYRLG